MSGHRFIALRAFLCCLPLVVGVGCAGTNCGLSRGHLMIAGGATSAENEGVYSRFVSSLPPDATIGVLPTASGVPEESAASSAATLRRYAGSRQVKIIDITTKTPERASDPAFVKQIEACGGLWFTGGDQSRIIATFRPAAGDTPGFGAARRIVELGGNVGGTSAGAAMMSNPMIIGGSSEDALSGKFRSQTGDSGFDVGKGMGFFEYGLTDQHFLKRGRFGRLVVALERTGLKRGFGIEENCALEANCETGRLTAIGPVPAVVVVDMAEARQDAGAHRGVRVSLLCDGDTVDGKTGAIHPLDARKPVQRVGSPRTEPMPEAWANGALTMAIRALAAAPEHPAELRSKTFVVKVFADERTRFFSDSRAPDLLTALDVRMDIVPLSP